VIDLETVLVRCPACEGRAVVRQAEDGLRLTCSNCGHPRLAACSRRHYERGIGMSLESYAIGANPFGAALLAYKLPKWMKLAKNRDEVLRAIERLRATL
jgi:hypothetical protein